MSHFIYLATYNIQWVTTSCTYDNPQAFHWLKYNKKKYPIGREKSSPQAKYRWFWTFSSSDRDRRRHSDRNVVPFLVGLNRIIKTLPIGRNNIVKTGFYIEQNLENSRSARKLEVYIPKKFAPLLLAQTYHETSPIGRNK